MPFIGNKPADSFTSFAKQDFTTSATTSYTLDYPVANANEIALFINFVRQEPTTAYSATGTSLTLTSATSATDDMYCVFLGKALQTVNPPAGSVGTSQLVDGAVTSAKLASGVGGSLVKLAETNVTSAVASVSFDGYFSSSYTNYIVYLFDVVPASSTLLNFRFSRSGTDVTTSHYSYAKHEANRSSGATGDTAAGGRWLANRVSNFADTIDTTVAYGGTAGHIEILNPLNTSHYKRFIARSTQFKSGLAEVHSSQLGGFLVDSTSAISGISFFMDSGNINSGLFQLYGVAN